MQWVQVQPLVRELRSYMPFGVGRKKKGKRGSVTEFWSVILTSELDFIVYYVTLGK